MISNTLFDLKGKIILVTGGYGYLGKSICEGLEDFGGIVYVLGRDKGKFDDVFQLSEHPNIHFISCDISDSKSIKEAFQQVEGQSGKIDVLINNAFYSKGQNPEEISDEDWNYSIDGSLNSVHRCIREIIPYFKKNKAGKIINVASMYGIVSPNFHIYNDYPRFLNPPHYGAAKAGVIQLTKYYGSYLSKYNITVNVVSPGPFPSDQVQKEEGFIEQLRSKNPLGKIGKPEDLKGAFVFLSSKASDYINGHNLVVDGGWTIW